MTFCIQFNVDKLINNFQTCYFRPKRTASAIDRHVRDTRQQARYQERFNETQAITKLIDKRMIKIRKGKFFLIFGQNM